MPMLANSQDLVVRLAASKAMKVVIDDFEFSVEELEPYLEQVFSLLFSLLNLSSQGQNLPTRFAQQFL